MPRKESTTTTETRAEKLRRLRGETDAPPIARDADRLVPDPEVWRELGITSMSGFRWERDPDLDFPPKIKVRGRNFRSRRMLEAFKEKLIRKALTDRAGRAA